MQNKRAGIGTSDKKTQTAMRIIAGSAAGRRLLSPRGSGTRPMMEKVRAALFDSVLSRAGSVARLPPGSRWLDLFAGTGSVGLEALSRGADTAHFVEMDPFVVRKVLGRNIETCGFRTAATCHTMKAEDFLRRAAVAPSFAGGTFDFVSMCPPYLLVSYPELFELLGASNLLKLSTILWVEYPKQLSHEIVDQVGPLVRVRARKYGRTLVATYAAPELADDYE
jgi:16S rRNA (guanine(966)-N(2))-methyltransferase RsmD